MARTESERRGLDVNFQAVDIEGDRACGRGYGLITVFRCLNRLLWPRLTKALAPDG